MHNDGDNGGGSESERRRSAEDDMLVEALAAGMSYAAAAGVVGCSSRKVQRRVADARFQERLAHRRALRTIEVVGALTNLEQEAVGVLGGVLKHGRPAEQLKAVALVLQMGPRLRAVVGADARLTAMEREIRALHADVEANDVDVAAGWFGDDDE